MGLRGIGMQSRNDSVSYRRVMVGGLAVLWLAGSAAAQAPDTTVSPDEIQPPVAGAAGSDPGEAIDPYELRIGPGDQIAIEVFDLPAFDREVRVETDGTISMPLVGSVEVAGLTPIEIAARIERILTERQLANDPEVSIMVKDLVSRGVWVQGAVTKPGVYQLLGPKTVLEILLEAGGLANAQTAGQKIIVVRRSASGQETRHEIDATRLMGQGDLSLNMSLRPGDIVLVPTPQTLRVYVSGAVKSPGPVTFLSSEGITLLQAITAAGGPTERANLGKVQVIRRAEDGTEERFEVDVKKIRKGKVEDFELEWNDTVVVREWFF